VGVNLNEVNRHLVGQLEEKELKSQQNQEESTKLQDRYQKLKAKIAYVENSEVK